MSNFRAGETVLCVHPGRDGSLPVGQQVTLSDVYNCGCGQQHVAFEPDHVYAQSGQPFACDCGQRLPIGPRWCYSHRFRHIENLTKTLALDCVRTQPNEKPDLTPKELEVEQLQQ